MNRIKRLSALLLAFIMVACLAPVTALAADPDEIRVFYYEYQDEGADSQTFYQDISGDKFELMDFDETGLHAQDGEFLGWALSTGSSSYYSAGSNISVSSADQMTNYYRIRVYAVWGTAKGQVRVTYSAGASDYQGSVPKSITLSKGGELTLPSNPLTVTGYTFSGWEIGGKLYQPGTTLTVSSDITITAAWSGNNVKVTYQPGEGTGTPFTSNGVTKGSQITLAANVFTRAGYAFAGWSINGQTYQPGTVATLNGDVTATAIWTAVQASSAPSSVPQTPPSSSSAPETSSESESESSEESSEPESSEESSEPESEPEQTGLTYKVEDDKVPVTDINMELSEDLGNTQLWVVALNKDLAGDATTRSLLESSVAAYDLSLLKDGSSYRGDASGKVEFQLTGEQSAADAPYNEAVLAILHVVSADKFTGESYYKKDGKKAVLWNVKDEKGEAVSEVSFDEKDGISRLIIADYEKLPESFAYMSEDGVIVEVQLVANVSATSASADFDSLSPFVLGWIELSAAKAAGGFSIPSWLWIVIGGIVVFGILAALLIFMRGKGSDEDRAASRLARQEAIKVRQSEADVSTGDMSGRGVRVTAPKSDSRESAGNIKVNESSAPKTGDDDWGKF